ncbi:MAG TPA: cell wall-binding repeat-containing protein, partial [Candidatus Limnocylindrales bacterium]
MRYPGRASNSSAHGSLATRVGATLAAVILLIGLFVPASTLAVVSTTISGKVADSGGAALAGITVQPGTITSSAFTAVGSPATTAGDGSYTVTVGTGRFAIRFSQASQVHAAGFYSSGGFVVDAASATTILATGAPVTGVNVRLPLSHAITGTVTNSGSTPVSGVNVIALTSAGNQTVSAITNLAGVYTLHVASGSYVLRFSPPAPYPSGYYTPTGLTTDLSAATRIAVAGADVTGKDIQLPTAKTISGTVTNASSAPVAGITVSAGLSTATTTAGGTYSLSVPPGSYRVTFQDPTNALPSGYYSTGGLTTSFAGATLVDVSTANALGIDVQLPAGAFVSGPVTGAGGAALSGINVWLIPVGAIDPLTVVSTSGSGTYSILAAPGSFILKFVDVTGAYSAGFYRSTVSSGFTKDMTAATAVGVGTSPVAVNPVQMPLYNTATRQSGADRYATAATISRATTPSHTPVVYVATGLNFPDALAAAAAAGHIGAPILLVQTLGLPTPTKTELTRLKPGKIIIAGGTGVVSNAVATQLGAYTVPAGTVERQSGVNRYATAASVSSHTFDPGVPVVYIATGLNFPDALAAAAAAGTLGGPVLLVTQASIPLATQTELSRLQPGHIIVAGGTGVVSNGVATQLIAYTSGGVERQSGANRYATAASVSSHTFAPGVPIVYVATGLNFPDAL